MSKPDTWDAYNELLLNGSLDRFTKLMARYELFKHIVDKPGDIVEGGVLKGAGVLFWAKLIQIFNPLSKRKVVGFDTFAGYPDSVTYEHDVQTGRRLGEAQGMDTDSTSPDDILKIAEVQDLSHRIELVKGDATSTIQQYVKDNPGFRVALLNMDFVLYDPTLAALEGLYPLVVQGGVIAFDEYATVGNGESDAVDEYFTHQQIELHSFPWALSPAAYMLKSVETSNEEID